jgi:hypothetical protein
MILKSFESYLNSFEFVWTLFKLARAHFLLPPGRLTARCPTIPTPPARASPACAVRYRYSSFSPPPVPCFAAAPFSVITTAGHPSPPSTVPKRSPFSCDAVGTRVASCRPPEPLIVGRLCRLRTSRRRRTDLVSGRCVVTTVCALGRALSAWVPWAASAVGPSQAGQDLGLKVGPALCTLFLVFHFLLLFEKFI